jgi:formyl-CoA transferase
VTDPLFDNPLARMANAPILGAFMEEIFASKPWDYWNETLNKAGITFGVVGLISDHLSDPQIEANGFLPEFSDGFGVRTVDSPFYLAGETKQPPRMAPEIGQHTREILEECGVAADEIDALMASE